MYQYVPIIVANLRRAGAPARFFGQKFGNKNAIKTEMQNMHPKKVHRLCRWRSVGALFDFKA